MESKERKKFLKTMYNQLWISRMEGVKERLQFTTIFALVLSGTIVIMKEKEGGIGTQGSLPWIVLLMLFSIFAVLFTLKVDRVLAAREEATNKIEELYELSALRPGYDRLIGKWINWISIGKIFPTFFFMFFCFLSFFLLKIVTRYSLFLKIYEWQVDQICAAIPSGIFLAFFIKLWWANIKRFVISILKPKKYKEEIKAKNCKWSKEFDKLKKELFDNITDTPSC